MRAVALAVAAATVVILMSVAACVPDRRTLRADEADGAADASAVDASVDGGCEDPSGFGGRGCYRCPITPTTTSDQLLRACTTSRFEVFDNAKRIKPFDPRMPTPPPPLDAGPSPPPFDAGVPPPDAGGDAGTSPPCPIGTRPNPVMLLGATGFPLEAIAKGMGSHATIFYAERSSCEGVASMFLNELKLSGDIVYFDNTDGKPIKCTLSEDHPADIASSGLFAQTCASQFNLPPANPVPAGFKDFLGPTNVTMFAVPTASLQHAVSAEAAWKVYGFGDNSGVPPWDSEELIFRRRPSSANQQVVALTLGLPPTAFRGRDSNGSSNMLSALKASSDPERTIGISSSEIVDTNRDEIRVLAYQHYNQPVAFYPDSDPASFDRRNVRDGHYFMWTPLHLFVRTNAVGDPVGADPGRNAAVKELTLVMASRQAPPVRSVDLLLGALKNLGNVPPCAMRVARAKEGDPLKPFVPEASCACAFEAVSPGAQPPECTRCANMSECTSGSRRTCSFGFCE